MSMRPNQSFPSGSVTDRIWQRNILTHVLGLAAAKVAGITAG